MSYYARQQNRRRSEATEQETVIQWCGWQQASHPELKLIYHIPNGGSRNTLEAANLKRQGVFQLTTSRRGRHQYFTYFMQNFDPISYIFHKNHFK